MPVTITDAEQYGTRDVHVYTHTCVHNNMKYTVHVY